MMENSMGSSGMKILGIDPGYAIVGYGVVLCSNGKYRSLEHGAITTNAGEDFNRRLEVIYNGVKLVIEQHRPDALAIEKLFFQSNQKTVIGVAEARGVILLAAVQANVPIFEYTPLQVKMAMTGYGRALKPQMIEMTKRLLNLKEAPKPDDTADALAMAICHGQVAGGGIKASIMTTARAGGAAQKQSGQKGIHLINKINQSKRR